MIAYNKNDTDKLQSLAIEYLNTLNQDPFNKTIFFQYAVSCNLYEDLTGTKIISPVYQNRLNNYFSNLEYWTYENIFLFSCIQ